jgi:acetylglutamate kinase
VAGTTPGVLDDDGANIPALAQDLESRLVAGRAINAGMIAKLRACREALAGGVPDVTIADGRDAAGLLAALRSPAGARGAATLIV